ncbi:MAG: hypothetical protein QOD49_1912, partial [Actinomycetota bacterium]|nr:hypothetical protein [Actinomycetota bacterium]
PDEHGDLYRAFAEIVAMGEGFPHDPGVALTYEDFSDYWLDHKSFVGVATLGGRFAGSYHLKPNFVGRGAHIANAGYFVVRELRGHGIGERLVRHSMKQAEALGFDALQFMPYSPPTRHGGCTSGWASRSSAPSPTPSTARPSSSTGGAYRSLA